MKEPQGWSFLNEQYKYNNNAMDTMQTPRAWHHEIGVLCVQNVDTILGSIANKVYHNWEGLCNTSLSCDHFERKRLIFILTFCVSWNSNSELENHDDIWVSSQLLIGI